MFKYENKISFNILKFNEMVVFFGCDIKKIIKISKRISAMEENNSSETNSYFKKVSEH